MQKAAYKMTGNALTTPAGVSANGSNTPVIKVPESDGRVIGLSVGENYARVDLAQLILTIKAKGKEIVRSVPATQLLPDGERNFYPLAEPIETSVSIEVNLVSTTANAAAATPLYLIFHHDKV